MSSPTKSARTVHKFGGASLAGGAQVRRVAALLCERVADRPIAVVSAPLGVTALLEQTADAAAGGAADASRVRLRHRGLLAQLGLDAELCNRHLTELATVLAGIARRGRLSAGERDHVLSFGERISARIVAAHLNQTGVRAVPIDAFDLGLVSDSNHGRASVLAESAARVRSALERIDGIPVITGFVAADAGGNLTTLGRNGSDLSAALIGEAIGAAEVVFWKDVGGVMSADPALVPGARTLRELSYAEAAEYTRHGASVLHADAVAPLERSRVPARVACVREPNDPGTRIDGEPREHRNVGVACRRGIARFALESENDRERVSAALARAGIQALRLCARPPALEVVAPWSDELARTLLALGRRAQVERELAVVAAVGDAFDPALVGTRFGGELQVRDNWLAGERGTAVYLVAEADLARTANAVHAALFELTGVTGGGE